MNEAEKLTILGLKLNIINKLGYFLDEEGYVVKPNGEYILNKKKEKIHFLKMKGINEKKEIF